MILIFTQSGYEGSTNDVIDWLWKYQAPYIRINLDELHLHDLKINVNPLNGALDLEMHIDNKKITNKEKHVIWFRRYSLPAELKNSKNSGPLGHAVRRHVAQEYLSLLSAFYSCFTHCEWLNHPRDLAHSKIHVLQHAIRAGLKIPDSGIFGSLTDVDNFVATKGEVITKCLSEAEYFSYEEKSFMNYTSEITPASKNTFNTDFYPSLFQKNISKSYELRVYYLNDVFYTVAIFSQSDKQTAIDFRVYNHALPNRVVPYTLPITVEEALLRLMHSLGMNCGSIDLICNQDGEYIFLEVNPIGQFGMVSHPGKYQLEKIVSEYLINTHLTLK